MTQFKTRNHDAQESTPTKTRTHAAQQSVAEQANNCPHVTKTKPSACKPTKTRSDSTQRHARNTTTTPTNISTDVRQVQQPQLRRCHVQQTHKDGDHIAQRINATSGLNEIANHSPPAAQRLASRITIDNCRQRAMGQAPTQLARFTCLPSESLAERHAYTCRCPAMLPSQTRVTCRTRCHFDKTIVRFRTNPLARLQAASSRKGTGRRELRTLWWRSATRQHNRS